MDTEESAMKTNVGKLDRIFRLLAGVALLSLLFLLESPLKWVGLLGLVYIATALARWCPAYSLMGINTCEVNKPE